MEFFKHSVKISHVKALNQLGLSEKARYAERDAELRQMRIIATALLLCMAALFVSANIWKPATIAIGAF